MIGFGTKDGTSKETLYTAITSDYFLIDSKDSNKSLSFFKNLKFDREKVKICSKLMAENHNPAKVYGACMQALEKAGLEYFDIYYIHTMHSFDNFHLLETYSELIQLQSNGKIRNIGVSNIIYEQLECILLNSIKPDYVQIEIHPYLHETRLVDFCISNNIKVIAHSPLGSSLWREISKDKILLSLSNKYKTSVSHIILRWHIQRNIIPIPSSNNYKNIVSNIKNLDFVLSDEDMGKIMLLDRNKRVYIKPNHYESIGKLCNARPIREIVVQDTGHWVLRDIQKKGFCMFDTNINNDLYTNCIEIDDSICINNLLEKTSHFNRQYEQSYSLQSFQTQISNIRKNKFLLDFVREYYSKIPEFNIFVKKSSCTRNLCPQNAGLFHRDLKNNKYLVIIIYLCDVTRENGPLTIVYPNRKDKIKWRNDSVNARTSYDEILKNYPREDIHVLEGKKYTCIVFEGNTIHSGGYVQKGLRNAIYIECI